MRYKSFRIENFKGIKDTTISFEGIGGANVFALVGLNESGKTTILEAIHSFSPDAATSELLGGKEGVGVPIKERVPRHLLSQFTGAVSVTATLSVNRQDKETIAENLLQDHNLTLNIDEFPDEIVMQRQQSFARGDHRDSSFTLNSKVLVKGARQRRWRDPLGDEVSQVRDVVYERTPDIAYFPTFVFDFPETIFLTSRGAVVDRFYRRVFQDILDYDGLGLSVDKDIVGRVRRKEMILPWQTFWPVWTQDDSREKIQHVMDRASSAVTRLVFGKWNQIFGEDATGKEVVISYEVLEGEKVDERGVKSKTDQHDVMIKFQVRDGTRRFNVNDRSLGFRWFFSFLLFTQFRVARSGSVSRPLLFLFDEPASNLHAAAQQKLIESFPEIARGEHVLCYSTHSHYMIEPKWLEQTFIVTNRADHPVGSVLEQASLDDESLDVQVATYRSFVNSHPGQTSYFQPILDRLEVVPSRFDMMKASIVVEGKSDYYTLRYAQKLIGVEDIPLLPGLGAGTFGALAALSVGWNLNFLFLLDGDKQGKYEKERYSKEFGIPAAKIVTVDELVTGVACIEDLLDDAARKAIQRGLQVTTALTKASIRRFFQEKLASDQIVDLGVEFRKRAKALLEKLQKCMH